MVKDFALAYTHVRQREVAMCIIFCMMYLHVCCANSNCARRERVHHYIQLNIPFYGPFFYSPQPF